MGHRLDIKYSKHVATRNMTENKTDLDLVNECDKYARSTEMGGDWNND